MKKQRDLTGDLQKQIDYVYVSIDTYVDDRLSKWNLSKLQSQLKSRAKNTTGIHAVSTDGDSNDVPAPPVPDMTALTANIERIVAAAVARTGRSNGRTPPGSRSGSAGSQRAGRRVPSATFKGCWCCGEEGHAHKDCKKFKAIRDANGGKVPKDYVGAYERSLKDKPKNTPVRAVGVSSMSEAPTEFRETVPLWPTLKSPVPISTSNKYAVFSDDDDDDDESEVVKALSALTPNVTTSSVKSKPQSVRRSQLRDRPLDFAHVNAIARDVKQGKINLPEVDLESDAEYTCLWALVDSGAGANAARKRHLPLAEPVAAPAITLSAANGEVVPNDGAHCVDSMHRDGTKTSRVFYHANVDMPILAVSELTKEGEHGSEIRFRRKDGIMIDNATGRRQHFVKRKGVYFIKLYVRKSGGANSGFTRPVM